MNQPEDGRYRRVTSPKLTAEERWAAIATILAEGQRIKLKEKEQDGPRGSP